MLLNELDQDILRIVAISVAQTQRIRDMLGLASTCRQLYTASRPFIPSLLKMDIPSLKFSLIRRTLAEDPSYGLSVYTLRMDKYVEDQQYNPQEMYDFFQQLPNLKTLYACDGALGAVPILLDPKITFQNSLRNIYMSDRNLSTSQLLDLLRLPKLRHFETQFFVTYNNNEDLGPEFENPSIRALKFHSSQMPCRTLSRILKSAPKLAKMNVKVSLHGHAKAYFGRSSVATIASALSPASILNTLVPASNSLVSLALFTSDQTWEHSHDGSRLDLSSFKVLRKITAHAELFVSRHSTGISRDGLYALLPRSLRSLHFRFNFTMGSLYGTHNQQIDALGRQQFLTSTLPPSSYEWILELARYKPTLLPRLRTVKMREATRERCALYSNEAWVPPFAVEKLFSEAGVKLHVLVRGPRRRMETGEMLCERGIRVREARKRTLMEEVDLVVVDEEWVLKGVGVEVEVSDGV